MKKKPICANCANPYGTRKTTTQTFKWQKGEPPPKYRGNQVVVRETMIRQAPHNVTGSIHGVPFGHNDNVAERRLWDGQSYYLPYKPFCTLRCALAYARAAHAEHIRNTDESPEQREFETS